MSSGSKGRLLGNSLFEVTQARKSVGQGIILF